MKTPLRVLILDDSAEDALLMVRTIEKAGYTVETRRIYTEADLKKVLEEQVWDVILSDYTMPQFTGLEALMICKERGLDVPFLIVSGVIDDARAVAAMKAGARD